MSKLSDLASKGKEVELSNGFKFEIKPMTLSEEVDIAEYQKKEDYAGAVALMVKNAIKHAVSDVTDEEIDNLNKDDVKKVTEVVFDINGMSEGKNEEARKNSGEN